MKLRDIEAIRANRSREDLMDLALAELAIDHALCQFESVPEPRFFRELPDRPATERPPFFNYYGAAPGQPNGQLPDDAKMNALFTRYLTVAPEIADS